MRTNHRYVIISQGDEQMKSRYKSYLVNLIIPAFVFGSVTGVITALVVTVYKILAKHIIHFSEIGYGYLSGHLYLVPAVVAVLFLVALLFDFCYKKRPNLRGGGIPTSIGILRGLISLKWFSNLIGTFFLSLTSFLFGVPLGNEGPSVQMGTAIGRGTVYSFAKKHRAWDRYSMTGGACAGFSVATGAPISGIMFAVEEAHQRISPMIIIVSSTSVMFSYITTEILSVLFDINNSLFPDMSLRTLPLIDVWVPLIIGVTIGAFAVLFLKYYKIISNLFSEKMKKIPPKYKIFFIFLLTLGLGLCSYSFISTGHELILGLMENSTGLLMLLLILIVRSTLTLSANTNGITGGMFVPILALGAVLSSILAKGMIFLFGLSNEYYAVILMLGIAACIAGMMKMPLTAIIFSVEALSCYENLLYVIIATAIAFVITEMFGVKSVNDSVLENRVEELSGDKKPRVLEAFVTVQKGSFAIGKQIRDIFWPANLFVLSVKHSTQGARVDEHGAHDIHEGDILHVRYATTDETQTREELIAIVGEQEYITNEDKVI